ncbi:MAG: murein biosynthesis integral membrane protein MurJ [Planctomycetota bacterium]|nr:murein biosynthesis integral membrane protein MurJ [Planctomycetota bacterium]
MSDPDPIDARERHDAPRAGARDARGSAEAGKSALEQHGARSVGAGSGSAGSGNTVPGGGRSGGGVSGGGLASAIRVVSGMTFLSRVAGLARDVMIARVFGASAVGSAFSAAFTIPNLFRRLFGEGALSAAYIPVYADLLGKNRPASDALTSMVAWTLTLVTGGITLVLQLALVAVLVLTPADADRSLSLKLMMLMLPMMPLVCLTAILSGALQTHGRFGPPAAAPIVLNFAQIFAAGAWLLLDGTDQSNAAYWLGIGAVAASVLQVLWSLAALRGLVRWTREFEPARGAARILLKRFLPVLLGLGTLQLNTALDTLWTMWPIWVGPTMLGYEYPLDESSNIVLALTSRLYQFPLGVFGLAVATAVFPMLSRDAANPERPEAFGQTLRRGLRLSFFIAMPAAVGLLLVGPDLTSVLFGSGGDSGGGGFDAAALERSSRVLAGFAPGVFAYSLNHVLTRAFYAKGDSTTPMNVSLAMVGLNLTLNLTLMWTMREAGLALATAITAIVQMGVLMRLCGSRLDTRPIDREALRGGLRVLVGSLVMAGAVAGVQAACDAGLPAIGRAIGVDALSGPGGFVWHLVRLIAAVGAGASAYSGVALLARLPELRWLAARSERGKVGAVDPE